MLTRIKTQQFDSQIEVGLYEAFEELGIIPEIQYSIGMFRVDMAFPEVKIAVECDGHKYHTGEFNWKKDRYRQKRIEQQGWKFERFQGWLIKRYPLACAGKIGLKYLKEKMSPKSIKRATDALEVMYLRSQ
jgi:very-short-patch-repair endonuclease